VYRHSTTVHERFKLNPRLRVLTVRIQSETPAECEAQPNYPPCREGGQHDRLLTLRCSRRQVCFFVSVIEIYYPGITSTNLNWGQFCREALAWMKSSLGDVRCHWSSVGRKWNGRKNAVCRQKKMKKKKNRFYWYGSQRLD